MSGDGTVGLYRLEVSLSAGTGKLKLGRRRHRRDEGVDQRAFSYMLAKKTELGIGREVDTSDFHVEAIDLLNNRVEAEIGVGFFVAAYLGAPEGAVAAATPRPRRHEHPGQHQASARWSSLFRSRWTTARERALIPIENKRNFLDVSADVMEHVDPIFYGDPKTAAFKALGLN